MQGSFEEDFFYSVDSELWPHELGAQQCIEGVLDESESNTEENNIEPEEKQDTRHRPRRKCAVECEDRIRKVLYWEGLNNDAPEVLAVAQSIDDELISEKTSMTCKEKEELTDSSDACELESVNSSIRSQHADSESEDLYESSFIDSEDETDEEDSKSSYRPPCKKKIRLDLVDCGDEGGAS